MSVTLAQARTKVRGWIDDAGGGSAPRWSTTEIDEALRAAQEEVARLIVDHGSELLRTTALVSSDAVGVVDVSSLAPMRVVGLSLVIGTTRYPLPRTSIGGYREARPGVESLVVIYDVLPTFPLDANASFLWGVSGSNTPLDSLMCAAAASDLKIKEGEDNPALERRKAELQALVLGQIPATVSRVRYAGARGGFGWAPTTSPTTFALVYV